MIAMNPMKSTQSVTNNKCLSIETLRQYLDGSSQEAISSEIDTHLESCSACNTTLEQLEARYLPQLQSAAKEMQTDNSNSISQEAELLERATAAAQSHKRPLLDTQFGPYRLMRRIGRGGMGHVYQAEHTKLKRAFALKLLPLRSASPDAIDRFEREIAAAGKLLHPAIVHSTDAGRHGDYLYLAMELIDGWDLSKLARSLSPLPTAVACEMGRQVALALAHAHSNGMVHRDIKPSNIMLDRSGKIKLLDFGLVMFDDWHGPVAELTTVGQFLGTLDYMAPEQAERSGQVDYRSDLYSLGATMFKLLTRHLPLAMYPNQSPIEKLWALSAHKPISVKTFRAELPESLVKLIDQMLNTDAKARPASAAHIAEALAPFCEKADLPSWTSQLNPALMMNDSSDGECLDLLPASSSPRPLEQNLSWWGGRLGWPLGLAAALLPFIVWFGFTMILQNQYGNLVIESEAADVRVRLLKGEQIVKQMSVQQGNSLTKLRAGQYEIIIDAPSDTFTVDQSSVVLKRGETVIARIKNTARKQFELGAASAPVEDPLAEKLRSQGITESTLSATYEGKRIVDHVRCIQSERELASWQKCLRILHSALSSEEREHIKPLVKAATEERKSRMQVSDWTKLRHWLDDEAIDRGVRRLLDDASQTEFTERLAHLASFLNSPEAIPVSNLGQTLELLETKLLQSSREELVQTLNSMKQSGLLPVSASNTVSDEILSQYPMTGFAICEYYQINSGPQFGSSYQVVSDPARQLTRRQAKLKLSQQLYNTKDYDKWLWLIDNTQVVIEGTESPESEYWDLVASQVGRLLDEWSASGVVMPETWVLPVDSRSSQFGGMFGGGMGGMGGMLGSSVPGITGWEVLPQIHLIPSEYETPGDRTPKISIGIQLLRVLGSIPKSMRPLATLEALSDRLAAKAAAIEADSEFLKSLPYNALHWDGEGRLIVLDPSDMGKTVSMDAEKQQALEAAVIRRWACGLYQSDGNSPEV